MYFIFQKGKKKRQYAFGIMISKWVSWILNFLVSFLFNFIYFFLRRPIQPRTRQSGWGKWMRRINIQPSAGHTREGCATQRAVLGSIQQADRAAAETLNNNELVTNRRKITQRNSRLDFSRYLLPQQLSGLEQQFHLYYPRLYFISLNIIPPPRHPDSRSAECDVLASNELLGLKI